MLLSKPKGFFIATFVIMLFTSVHADTATIDFDSLPSMNNAPGSIVPSANQLSNQFLTSLGVSFSSQANYVAVVDHDSPPGCGSPGKCPTVSEPNIIGGVKSDGTLSYGTPIMITFFYPLNPSIKGETDFVSIRGEMVPLPGATATMEAFDAFGKSLDSVSAFDSTAGLTLSISAKGIHSVTLTQDSASSGYDGTIGFDNLQFNTVSAVAQELLFTAVTPCRIVDTRKTSSGIIGTNSERNFRVYGSVGGQGGNSAGCLSPGGEPYAAHINMIAVTPTGKGNLQAFPVGAGPGAGLSVNYNTIDTNLANAGTVKTITGTGPDITVRSNFSSAHTVIDVLGYYYPDEGFYYTPVEPCRIVDTRKTPPGTIDAGTERDLRVFGSVSDQGGNPAGCPSTLGVHPKAVHLNMIAVDPADKGNLQAFPMGAGTGAGLSVNYNIIDTNLANAGTVKTVTGAGPDISVASNFSSAHTVIDVLGYYSEEEDLLYTPVTPCRIVDTRKTAADIINANTQRNFRVFGSVGSQGGNSSGCSSPLGQPLAAHINMIAVNPTGKGNLQAFPVGAGAGAGLSVNYNTIDTNLANAGTVKTITGTGPDITVRSNFSSSHTVIDVLGFYYPAP